MRRLRFLPVLVAALLLAACGGGAQVGESTSGGMPPPAAGAPMPAMEPDAERAIEEAPATDSGAPAPQVPASQRLVIKNASLSVEVEDVAVAEAQLRARAEALGGYIVSVETSGSGPYLTSLITFRVPAERFE